MPWIKAIPIDEISNEFCLRKYSKESIEKLRYDIELHGLGNPIIVKQEGENYIILDGGRRVEAAKALGHTTIKAKIMSPMDLIMHYTESKHRGLI
jgi:ParB-like chromosome segregation protein Spo0J